MTTQAIEVRRESPLTVKEILDQKAIVQEVMKAAMKEKEHYGTIPGCGDKPTLLQPGAEMLLLLFRMNPDYVIERRDMERGHLEYNVVCKLTNSGGEFIGAGVGSACTMESKWRFRTGPKKLTDREVPKAYWDTRKSDPKAAQELIGGRGFSTQKNEHGQWMIAEGGGEKVENENPADIYNTCLKIAKKRALVDAVRTRTAASDIFAQDLEDLNENRQAAGEAVIDVEAHKQSEAQKTQPTPQNAPQRQPEAKNTPPVAQGQTATGDDVCECVFESWKLIEGTNKTTGKPYKFYACKFDQNGQQFEASTFSDTIAKCFDVLQGQKVRLTTKPGRKAGTTEIVALEPSDDVGF